MPSNKYKVTKQSDVSKSNAPTTSPSLSQLGMTQTSNQPDKNELKHTIANPRSSSPDSILRLQQTIGNKAVQRLLNSQKTQAKASKGNSNVVQRKGGNITTVETMKKNESFLISDEYDDVVTQVTQYYNSSLTPNDDYGKQLIKLEEIGTSIKKWEDVKGPVNKPVTSGIFGTSTDDKRRLVLKDLQDKVTLEQQHVQQQGKDVATDAHSKDRAKLQEYVDEGFKSSDRVLKNSCEWIKLGKTKLYAVTPTGDSYARLIKGKKNPAKDEAWFPTGTAGSVGDLASGPSTYNHLSITDNANVNLDDDGKVTGGWNGTGFIAVTNAAKKTQEKVWETLRHEVQHDSDKNMGRDAQANTRKYAEEFDNPLNTNASASLDKLKIEMALQSYKTEYRAYSYQEGGNPGPYASLDNTVQNKNRNGFMFSARQLAIFNHIYGGYAHTKDNWDANPTMRDGRTFRQAVQSYWNPDKEGFNKYNSARVDDVYLALDAIGTKAAPSTIETTNSLDFAPVTAKVSDKNDPTVKALMTAIEKLNGDDADYIVNEGEAMQKKIKAHLGGEALKLVESELRDLAANSKLGSKSLFD